MSETPLKRYTDNLGLVNLLGNLEMIIGQIKVSIEKHIDISPSTLNAELSRIMIEYSIDNKSYLEQGLKELLK